MTKFHIYDQQGNPSKQTFSIEEIKKMGLPKNTMICPVMGKPAPLHTFLGNDSVPVFGQNDLISILILCFSWYLVHNIVKLSQSRQEIVSDKSEIGNIKYGLFNIYEWRTKVSAILDKKIDEFELNNENKGEIQHKIENMLYWVLDEVKRIMNERANQGILGALSSFFGNLVLDVDDLRSRVPEFSQRALNELGNDATMADIKFFIKSKLKDYLQKTFGEEDKTTLDKLLSKYNCERNSGSCIKILENKKSEIEASIWQYSIGLILSVALIFGLFYNSQNKTIYSVYILLAACLVILIAGLLTPMIDLDARINQLSFTLMGEPIAFSEQILFFQSKSIWDVVTVLVKSGRIDSVIVGSLIFVFSILFPLLKLNACVSVLQNPTKLNNKLTNFLVIKSGKWSMADVIVVAIIMAYIGFQGIINSQLAKIQLFSNKIDVMTTNHTQLQIGFIIFTTFCMLGIAFSTLLEKYIVKQPV